MGMGKKKPADYPQFNFRLPSEQARESLRDRLEKAYTKVNKGRDETEEYAVTRAEILLAALEEGLGLIEAGKIKLRSNKK